MGFRFYCVAGLLASLAATGGAQTVSPASPPANAQAMPGDYFDIPQSAQLKVPLGPPAGRNTNPPGKAARPVPSLSFGLARLAAETAEKSCADDGYAITVAVTDGAGQLKAALAADGTRENGIYMAMHKAVTVVAFKMSTLELRANIEKDPSLLAQVKPNMSLLPGGVPIFDGGRFVGAIATSGASAYVEEKCAKAGIDQIRAQLGAAVAGQRGYRLAATEDGKAARQR